MITLTKTVTMKWKHVLWQNKDQPTKINSNSMQLRPRVPYLLHGNTFLTNHGEDREVISMTCEEKPASPNEQVQTCLI